MIRIFHKLYFALSIFILLLILVLPIRTVDVNIGETYYIFFLPDTFYALGSISILSTIFYYILYRKRLVVNIKIAFCQFALLIISLLLFVIHSQLNNIIYDINKIQYFYYINLCFILAVVLFFISIILLLIQFLKSLLNLIKEYK